MTAIINGSLCRKEIVIGNTDVSDTLKSGFSYGIDYENLTEDNYGNVIKEKERTTWTVDTDYSLGDIVIPSTPNGYVYECTVAGISDDDTEPTWTTTVGNTNVEGDTGTVTWTCRDATFECWKFNPNFNGIYDVNASVALTAFTAVQDKGVVLTLAKNGTEIEVLDTKIATAAGVGATTHIAKGSTKVRLASSDYISIFVKQDTGADQTIINDAKYNNISIVQLQTK